MAHIIRNPILIISAGNALVNKGQICKTLYEVLQEINFSFGSGNFLLQSGLLIKKKKRFSLTQFLGILTIAILKSYRNGSSSNFLFVQEIVRTEVNYFLLHPVV